MSTATSIEREIKLRFDSVEAAREAVLATGATPLRCRRLQEDSLLDTEDESLRRRRCVLRIRVECGKSRITFKGPVQPSIMKVRDELETVVGDGVLLVQVFEEASTASRRRLKRSASVLQTTCAIPIADCSCNSVTRMG
jgi:adenylate cyclase class IV